MSEQMPTAESPSPEREALIRALVEAVGEERVLTSHEDRVCYSFDASKDFGLPAVAVLVETAEHVVAVVNAARRLKVPIIARGAGSGMTGGAIPPPNGITLVFTKMDRILEINTKNLTATMQPGVVIADLNAALEKVGLWYPPDPASAKIATFGGSVAESSGGLRGVKWGTTRDYILRLEVVTMDGQVLRLGAGTYKSVSGYDLVRQIVGSEGTLAIITEIMVKVVPKPQAVETVVATFDNEIAAFEAASAVIAEPVRVATLEALDGKAVNALWLASKHPLLEGAKGFLLIECDGHPAEAAEQIAKAEAVCRARGAVRTVKPANSEERDRLWEIRRSLSTAVYQIRPKKISEDICVPQSRMAEAVRRIREIEAKREIVIINFGHAGDGNFHVNCMFDPDEDGAAARVNEAIHDVFSLAIELGGTLTGEHGIGSTKRDYMRMEHGEAELNMMRRIKAAWDPENLLNPGKIIPN